MPAASRPLTRDERVAVVKILRSVAKQEKTKATDALRCRESERAHRHRTRQKAVNDLATAFETREVGG